MKLAFFIALSSFLHLSSSLFLDQIGKFDWRKRYIGCPQQTWFGNVESQDALFIVSKENVIGRINVENGDIVWRQINEDDGNSLKILAIDRSTIITQIGNKQRAFDLHTGTFQWQKTKLSDDQDQMHLIETGILNTTFSFDNSHIEIHFQESKIKFKLENAAQIKDLKVLNLENNIYKIFIQWADCRIELYEFSLQNGVAKNLWCRHESLASISEVLMVDLPLSESQAQIESEFNLNESVLRSFILRIRSQLEQFHRFCVKTTERFFQTLDLIIRGEFNYSVLFNHFFNDGQQGKDMQLERDYFNIRKMIVVSTLAGTLNGFSSENGNVHWTIYLGDKFTPYKDSKIPLFLMRGTAYYQWASQAAVVFDIKNSPNSMLLLFNPITGEIIDKQEVFGGVLRVDIWPFVTSEQLHPLMIIRKNRQDKVEFLPNNQREFSSNKPVFMMFLDKNSGFMTGFQIDIDKDGHLTKRWRASLPNFEKDGRDVIEAVRGKPANEKVHSQGRVLGDRSVLYKYINSNLVAILSSNKVDLSLHINLIDIVSGQLIFTGKYSRAQAPYHIVHCENWILISYWSEKARRTEIAIIELFEGPKQTNSTAFDSLAAINEPIKIISQTFIFPQGIRAISATQTEQGLTSISLLIAVPFGGILEMSRRFLDARRPLEMTPEFREEMLIPYIPELPLATEDLINYNQTIAKVRGIRTAPSGLESTSLVFVYGLDLFYTRSMPSGTFDILKDDFDYAFIAAVMVLLTAAAYMCKRISRYQSIQKAWE